MATYNYLAIDFGASNGRGILFQFDGKKILPQELHRFENTPIYLQDTLFWDLSRLFDDLKKTISKACHEYSQIRSVGVDTWGVDFVLLDSVDRLLSNPVHYRDKRTSGISEKIFKLIKEKDLFFKTQAQVLEINTLFQLYSLKENGSILLQNARSLLMLGDLFHFFLTGEKHCEYTNATTTQLMDQKKKRWSNEIFEILGLPNLFSDLKEPGSIIGTLRKEICDEIGCSAVDVSLPAYDTASEIAGVPFSDKEGQNNKAFLSCGTWAMVGIVNNKPLAMPEVFKAGFGNEGGLKETYNLLINMSGLWIIGQCRKKWNEEHKDYLDWNKIVYKVQESIDRDVFIDVDDPSFERELFDMPARIIDYCEKTGQQRPQSIGEIARICYESLALKYAYNLTQIERLSVKNIELLHMVGGGSQNALLCQFVSNATGRILIAGPAEATAVGNALAQMIATDAISDLNEGREIIRNSFRLTTYFPKDMDRWQKKCKIFIDILKKYQKEFHGR